MDGDSKRTSTGGQQQQPPLSQQPPHYYMSPPASSYGGAGCGYNTGPAPSYQQAIPLMQTSGHPTTVMVTQPVYVGTQEVPNTSCALILTTISAIFCGFWCGAAGIIFAWKARMQVLEQKYVHARHTLCVAWIFFFVACVFGLIIWAMVGFYLNMWFWYW